VVVTGANGFVGARTALALRDRGWHVRLCSRKVLATSRSSVQEFLVPRLDDHAAWDRVLPGADVVVHCAGLAHVGEAEAIRRRDEFKHVNVQGTIALASAALRHSVRRFVFVSSIGVNGSRTAGCPIAANDPVRPSGVYAESKLEAEIALARLAHGTTLETVIVRPCLVVGPGAPGNLERLVNLLRRGWWLPLGAIDNRRSLVGVEALAELLAIAAEHPLAAGRVFLAAQGQPVTTTEIVRALARGASLNPRLFGLPARGLRLLGTLTGRRCDVDRLCDSLEVDASAAHELLDWVCSRSVLADLEEMSANHANV